MLWEYLTFILLDGLIIYGIFYFLFRIKKFGKKEPENARRYGNSIISGIVAGITVIILDRGVNLALENKPQLDFSSISLIFYSSFNSLLMLIFEWGLIFLLIFFIIASPLKK